MKLGTPGDWVYPILRTSPAGGRLARGVIHPTFGCHTSSQGTDGDGRERAWRLASSLRESLRWSCYACLVSSETSSCERVTVSSLGMRRGGRQRRRVTGHNGICGGLLRAFLVF
jgi:hypothetical protein